ncbi:MAG: glycosyltransferase family 4 protein [Candidatus Eiseniibacteriota bacterium]
MRIGLGLLNQSQVRSGVELFEARVGARLVAQPGPWSWRVYTRGMVPAEWSGVSGFEESVCAPRRSIRGGRLWSEQVSWPLELSRRPVELVASLAFYPPRSVRVPFLMTVHDLTVLERPLDYPLVTRLYAAALLRDLAPRAHRIATPSQWVKDRCSSMLGVAPERIDVVYSGVEQAYFAAPAGASDAALAARLGIRGPFWLSCGSLQPRKNLEVAVRSLALLKRRGFVTPQLVVVGKLGPHARSIGELGRALGVGEQVVLAGRLEDHELAALYRECNAFVYPSWAEGFGVPPLEALAAGARVIAARASCLPEILGEHAVWADPADPESWCAAWLQVQTESQDERASRREQARAWVRRYTWDDTGRRWRAMLERSVSELGVRA